MGSTSPIMQIAGFDIGRIALGVIVLIALVYAVAGALLYMGQRRLIYMPDAYSCREETRLLVVISTDGIFF